MSTAHQLLTPDQAGEILRLTSARVTRLARTGQIPAIVLPGGDVRFIAAELWGWLEKQRVEEVAPA